MIMNQELPLVVEERPKWTHKIPEATARWIATHSVMSIHYKWRMTGADTSEDWLELRTEKGEETRRVPTEFLKLWEIEFYPGSRGLLSFRTYAGVEKTIKAIDNFDTRHRDELATYKRLKKKYEGHLID